MAGPKPTLGYPTRTAAVQALRAEGKSTQEITDAIGIDTSAVSALENSALRKVVRGSAEMTGRAMLLPNDVMVSLERHAARRGVTANNLARTILERVIDDKLVDAVLDDGEEIA